MGTHRHDARQAVARIERAIGTPEFELAALHAVADAVGTERAVWMRHSREAGASTMLAPSIPAYTLPIYARDFAHLNPFVPHSVRLPAGTVVRTSSVLAQREYRRLPYYGWASRVFGAYELACIVSRIDDSALMVSFGRGQGQGDFTRTQESQLRRVATHLRRAYFLHARMPSLDGSPCRHLLEHVANTGACFALSRDGVLVEANALGDLELHDASTVELVDGRIRFRAAMAQRAFTLALRSGNPSAAIGLGAPEPAGTALLVDVGNLDMPVASRPARWLLFVPAGRGSRQRLRLEAVALEHGLSELECRVLGLLALGRDVGEVARELGHQPSTTRTVVKSLFRKTGAHRQTELLLRVLG